MSSCPCNENCSKKRAAAVNVVLEKRTCTSKEIRQIFQEKDLSKYATRKGLEFLSSGDCKLIDCVKSKIDQKPLRFKRLGRLFYSKNVPTYELNDKVLSLLSPLQTRILEKFFRINRKIYHFSMYDLRKMHPNPGNVVAYSINRLAKLGLVENEKLEETDFFVNPYRLSEFSSQHEDVIIEDKVEYIVIKTVHELIMNLFPLNVIVEYADCIRPRSRENITITGGMAFDIFYKFRDPIFNRKYLAVDVYTRIPVTGYIVHSFIKKIEYAKTRTRKKTTNYLKDKTFGMIVFRNATDKAIEIANKNGLRFLRLNDVKIDYKGLREGFAKFRNLLNELKNSSKISAEQFREYQKRWFDDPQDRETLTAYLETKVNK